VTFSPWIFHEISVCQLLIKNTQSISEQFSGERSIAYDLDEFNFLKLNKEVLSSYNCPNCTDASKILFSIAEECKRSKEN
jgi:hypothetical protein